MSAWRRRLMGVAAIGLLVAGAWLGSLFRGWGLGGGTGSGTGDGTAEQPSADTHVSVAPEFAASTESVSTTAPRSDAASDPLLTVLIEADQYFIQSGEDAAATFSPAALSDVARQAAESPGNEYGVRVRLRFRRNAQSGAISDLYKALQEAGVPREQVVEGTEYVD